MARLCPIWGQASSNLIVTVLKFGGFSSLASWLDLCLFTPKINKANTFTNVRSLFQFFEGINGRNHDFPSQREEFLNLVHPANFSWDSLKPTLVLQLEVGPIVLDLPILTVALGNDHKKAHNIYIVLYGGHCFCFPGIN